MRWSEPGILTSQVTVQGSLAHSKDVPMIAKMAMHGVEQRSQEGQGFMALLRLSAF